MKILCSRDLPSPPHVADVFGELESSSYQQPISERGVAKGAEEPETADRFIATRSLLRGKVSTTTIEASNHLMIHVYAAPYHYV